MTVVRQVLVQTLHLVERQLDHRALGGTQSSTTPIPTPTETPTSIPSPSNMANNNNSGTSSPLLFFVALGFGVVFTNLW
jgi:hypothetical protein